MTSHENIRLGEPAKPEFLLYPDDLRDILDGLRGEQLTPEEVVQILLDGGIELDYLSERYQTSAGPKNLFLVVLCQDTLTVDYDDLQRRCDRSEDLLLHVSEEVRDDLLEARRLLGSSYEDSPYMAMEWAVRTAQASSLVREFERMEHLLAEIRREKGKWKAPETMVSQLQKIESANAARSSAAGPLRGPVAAKTTISEQVTVEDKSPSVDPKGSEKTEGCTTPSDGHPLGVVPAMARTTTAVAISDHVRVARSLLGSAQTKIESVSGLAGTLSENSGSNGFHVSWGREGWNILSPGQTPSPNG
jgi:hypothetical protein